LFHRHLDGQCNEKLSDEDFRTFVRNSVTQFHPELSVVKITAKRIADRIRHCGDYGNIYFKEGSVFVVLGDADGDEDYGGTSEKEIEENFKSAGIRLEMEAELGPWDGDPDGVGVDFSWHSS